MIFSKFQTTPIIVITFIALLFPAFAEAYFSSDAEATGNTFNIGTLDIEVDNTSHSVGVTSASNESFDFDVSETGTISAQYQLIAAPTVCTSDFYNGINVEVTEGSIIYSGPLSGLSATTTSDGLWDIVVTNDSISALDSETCEVDLILQAWQEEFTASSTGGFSEEITIELTVTANENLGMYATPPDVVLNEIMPNPTGDDWQDGLLGEWVELYNNTNQVIDLNGWYIKDLAGAEIVIGGTSGGLPTTENGTTTIEAFGWLVVYMNVQILDNTGTETVYLYDNNNVLQNGYTYTAGSSSENDPEDGDTPGADNGDDDVAGTSGSASVGKSDARIPDGIGVWVDPEPTAGEPNYVSREELEEVGYAENKIEFLLARQEDARQMREVREANEQQEQLDVPAEIPTTAPAEGTSKPIEGESTKGPAEGEEGVLKDGEEKEDGESEEDLGVKDDTESTEDENVEEDISKDNDIEQSPEDEDDVSPDSQIERLNGEEKTPEPKKLQELEPSEESKEKVLEKEESTKQEEESSTGDDINKEQTENSDV